MSIRDKLGIFTKRCKLKTKMSIPICTRVRSRSLKGLYTYEDFLIDLLRHYTIKQRVYHPHIPTLIVKFLPIYTWENPWLRRRGSDEIKDKLEHPIEVILTHCKTIASNCKQKFGTVLGSKLDPRLDHIINIQLLAGFEFGVGLCNQAQIKDNPRRDFMCIEGGYGYYNYKNNSTHLKPKYPAGFYFGKEICHKKIRAEAEICQPGDVLSIVVQRENLKSPGGGIRSRSRYGSTRDLTYDPMNNLQASPKHTISFYKNGQDMGSHLRDVMGTFYLCLNFYFVESKLRLISEYDFLREHRLWARKQIPQLPNHVSNESSKVRYTLSLSEPDQIDCTER